MYKRPRVDRGLWAGPDRELTSSVAAGLDDDDFGRADERLVHGGESGCVTSSCRSSAHLSTMKDGTVWAGSLDQAATLCNVSRAAHSDLHGADDLHGGS